MTPGKELLAWVKDNPRAPSLWIAIAERMASDADIKQAWPSLIKAGAKPVQVFGMIADSLEESAKDVRRLPAAEEAQSIEGVRKAAKELLIALQGAQLLDEGGPVFAIGTSVCTLSLTDNHHKQMGDLKESGIDSISLPEALRGLEARCADILEDMPSNAIIRKTGGRNQAMRRAFIRRLAWRFRCEFGESMPANLARIANAIFDKLAPVTDREASSFIEDSPLTG